VGFELEFFDLGIIFIFVYYIPKMPDHTINQGFTLKKYDEETNALTDDLGKHIKTNSNKRIEHLINTINDNYPKENGSNYLPFDNKNDADNYVKSLKVKIEDYLKTNTKDDSLIWSNILPKLYFIKYVNFASSADVTKLYFLQRLKEDVCVIYYFTMYLLDKLLKVDERTFTLKKNTYNVRLLNIELKKNIDDIDDIDVTSILTNIFKKFNKEINNNLVKYWSRYSIVYYLILSGKTEGFDEFSVKNIINNKNNIDELVKPTSFSPTYISLKGGKKRSKTKKAKKSRKIRRKRSRKSRR